MSQAAKTLYYFSYYMVACGAGMLLWPELTLKLAHLPMEGVMWVRVMGLVVLILSYYYRNLARYDVVDFCRWTVHTRGSLMLMLAVMVVIYDLPAMVIAFGIPDLFGAAWTWYGLKQDGHSPFTPINPPA